jgi:hypothetical protein
MMNTAVTLHLPTTFEIRVPGRLNPSWVDHVDASTITYTDDEEEGPLTVVMLRNADQSALIGLINVLFGLGVPLVSVRHITNAKREEPGTGVTHP